jgi:hypothetical protein
MKGEVVVVNCEIQIRISRVQGCIQSGRQVGGWYHKVKEESESKG